MLLLGGRYLAMRASKTLKCIILLLFVPNPLFSQIVAVDRDSLFFPTVSSADTFTVSNVGTEPLVVDSIGSVVEPYLYNFAILFADTIIYNHFVGGFYLNEPFELVLNGGDSAKFIIFSPDLCPVCKTSARDYFEDTLLLFNNSINQDTVRIFMSGEGFNILDVRDTGKTPEIKQPILYPNYPNPFNASTRISYQLPTRQHVRLVIYNSLGMEVVVLVDGVQNTGFHTVELLADDLPSGLYFYRLEAQRFIETGKLALVK